jgi:hypothetical protein
MGSSERAWPVATGPDRESIVLRASRHCRELSHDSCNIILWKDMDESYDGNGTSAPNS